MSVFGGLIFTNRGRNLQAKAQAGAQLTFTRIAVGDGNLGGVSIADLTALIHEVKSLGIGRLRTLADGKALVGTVLSNQDLITGFYWRELGVFAQDPDLGEVLYCYGNAGANAEYIPAGGGPDVVEKNIDVITIVGNAASVTATIDESLIFATQADLTALQQDLDALAGAGRTTETVKGNADALAAHLTESLQHHSFLALVQKHYKNVSLDYGYITQNAEKLVGSVSITGDITATINYTYNAATNALEQEQISVTAPFAKTITTTYTYDVDGDVDIEQRSVS